MSEILLETREIYRDFPAAGKKTVHAVSGVSLQIREGETLRCAAKFRYRQADQPVEVRLQDGQLMIHALTPQRAVTPGQSAVLYLGDECLGGGIVTEILDAGSAEA